MRYDMTGWLASSWQCLPHSCRENNVRFNKQRCWPSTDILYRRLACHTLHRITLTPTVTYDLLSWKNGTPVTHALGRVHTNFGTSSTGSMSYEPVWIDGRIDRQTDAQTYLLGGSVVRALDSGPRGCEFDSRRLRFRVTRSTQPSIPPG